jgi:hypothetical protein
MRLMGNRAIRRSFFFMEAKMKKVILSLSALIGAFLIGCADSSSPSQGGAGSAQSERGSQNPSVASDSGTREATGNQAVESKFNTLGSVSAPAGAVPANVTTNAPVEGSKSVEAESAPSVSGGSTGNEQGNKSSPEPETGDDANPDSIRPEIR